MIELVLWDLDETLLPTETLRSIRHADPIDLRAHQPWSDIRLHDGVADAFTDIGPVAVGLVTSSPRWYVQQILEAHLPAVDFVVVVTYDDVTDLKPHPESLLLATSRAGVSPSQCIYIGDDAVDHQACQAAGVPFFGAGWVHRPTYPARGVSTLKHPREVAEMVHGRYP